MSWFLFAIVIALALFGLLNLVKIGFFKLIAGPADRALNSLNKQPGDWKREADSVYVHKSGLIAISKYGLYTSDAKVDNPSYFRHAATNEIDLSSGQRDWFERIIKGYKEKKVATVVHKAFRADKEAVKATKSDEKAVKQIKEAGTF